MPDAGLADGSVLTSANYDTYLRQQVVAQVLSSARPTGVDGRLIAETDTDRIVCHDGTNWVRIANYSASGRSGVQLARFATQSIPTFATTAYNAVSWDVETTDTDGYITATSDTITIPTGLGGLYAISAVITWASSPGANSSIEVYVNGTTSWRHPIGAGTQMTTCSMSVIVPVAAAQTVQVRLSQGTGSSINVTGNLEMWRLSA